MNVMLVLFSPFFASTYYTSISIIFLFNFLSLLDKFLKFRGYKIIRIIFLITVLTCFVLSEEESLTGIAAMLIGNKIWNLLLSRSRKSDYFQHIFNCGSEITFLLRHPQKNHYQNTEATIFLKEMIGRERNVNEVLSGFKKERIDSSLLKDIETFKKRELESGFTHAGLYNFFPLVNTTNNTYKVGLTASILNEERTTIVKIKKRIGQKKLDQSFESKQNTLMCSLSHEVRTPLNHIFCMLDTLKAKLNDPIEKECLGIAESSATVLHFKMDDFQDYLDIENNQFKLNYSECNLNVLVQEIASICNPQIHQKKLNFFIDLSIPQNYKIYSDSKRLQQVLLNLIINAIKYTEEGSVTLKIERYLSNLYFSVIDTGCGIPKNQLKKLFSLFGTCSENTNNFSTKLAGLGLTISSQICLQFGTYLTAHSEVGRGTKFEFCINPSTLSRSAKTLPFPKLKPAKHPISRLKKENTMKMSSGEFNDVDEQIKGDFCKSMPSFLTQTHNELFEFKMKKSISVPPSEMLTEEKNCENVGKSVSEEIKKGVEEKKEEKEKVLEEEKDWRDELKIEGEEGGRIKERIKMRRKKLEFKRTNSNPCWSKDNEDCEERIVEERKSLFTQNEVPEVLIVDDNSLNLLALRSLLLQEGIHPQQSLNGKDAYETIKVNPNFKLILMDLQMPVMDGIQATIKIRHFLKTNHFTQVPIVAVTAFATTKEKQKCLDAGMNAVILKPVRANSLRPVLLKYLT
jgi:signal transduction histidine kinase/CheY-like chemotaxis protein